MAGTALPLEILHDIFTYPLLDSGDWKSLRLVCLAWSAEATSLLFHRIRLSKLKSDRSAFFNIAASHHLAIVVRELVWEELAEDDWSFKYFDDPRAANPLDDTYTQLEIPDQGVTQLYEHLIEQAQDMFWLEVPNVISIGSIYHQPKSSEESMETFRSAFHAALDSMPYLHTFISRPMHPYRVLTKPGHGYPISAQLFQRGMVTFAENNYGFSKFLGPAMMYRYTSGQSPIRRLYYGDEGWTSGFHRYHRIDESVASAFAALTHLDFCFSMENIHKDMKRLALFFEPAHNLTNLSLCAERGEMAGPAGIDAKPWRALDVLMVETDICLPALRSLHLEDMPVKRSALVKFVARHARTLQRLAISGRFQAHLLWNLAQIRNLQLKRFSCALEDDTLAHLVVSEQIVTKWDNLIAIEDVLHEHSKEAKVYLQTLPAFSIDTDQWELRPAMPGMDCRNPSLIDSQDYTAWNAEAVDSDDDTDSPENDEYAVEDEINDRRFRDAPRWSWSWHIESDTPGQPATVYYWMIPPHEFGIYDLEEHPTEMWRFTHHSGQIAYGDEPLNFWEDWEGTSESGDVAEPVPYGWHLLQFVGEVAAMSSVVPSGTRIPFEKAARYNAAEDPLSNDSEQAWSRVWRGDNLQPEMYWS